ncbi:hypothetical protein BaRGS_00022503 [Batillaria attramentaria]|uniref:Uncharacterized protein n=1 Tax=Batillaria attramentaria TaxID=370345 RepID=A0ABD0KG78_9CAEN
MQSATLPPVPSVGEMCWHVDDSDTAGRERCNHISFWDTGCLLEAGVKSLTLYTGGGADCGPICPLIVMIYNEG